MQPIAGTYLTIDQIGSRLARVVNNLYRGILAPDIGKRSQPRHL